MPAATEWRWSRFCGIINGNMTGMITIINHRYLGMRFDTVYHYYLLNYSQKTVALIQLPSRFLSIIVSYPTSSSALVGHSRVQRLLLQINRHHGPVHVGFSKLANP